MKVKQPAGIAALALIPAVVAPRRLPLGLPEVFGGAGTSVEAPKTLLTNAPKRR
jgi:hypothetical protein